MAEVLPALDRHPAVERYAWYTARDSPDEPGGVHTPVGGALLADAHLRQAWHWRCLTGLAVAICRWQSTRVRRQHSDTHVDWHRLPCARGWPAELR